MDALDTFDPFAQVAVAPPRTIALRIPIATRSRFCMFVTGPLLK